MSAVLHKKGCNVNPIKAGRMLSCSPWLSDDAWGKLRADELHDVVEFEVVLLQHLLHRVHQRLAVQNLPREGTRMHRARTLEGVTPDERLEGRRVERIRSVSRAEASRTDAGELLDR